ncbi:hypothetical protein HYH03_010301 [Edaphochlamys debaryana]|uniref:Uncharacterized protein n=1 Tax=Edaphochlamys debaryana TaxID=47281 RepID=A0A835XWT0_9CHLO|nr:hypothetical protein HYH03_010301 [Edaphochlamys debaryana]|eukprot:KAG2491295.1 hypothetical protein HYH03_010301 [Edaphochlamys debaryana]
MGRQKGAERGSATEVTCLQVRTRAVYGLNADEFRTCYLQVSIDNGTRLNSATWTVARDGSIPALFYVRLPRADAVEFRLVPTARSYAKLFAKALAPTLYATLDVAGDAAAAAEAQQGRVVEGLGGSWRSVQLTLRPHTPSLPMSGAGLRLHPHASAKAELLLDYCLVTLPPRLAHLPELDLAQPLARPLHSYAHGGFMGAALSLLADPQWSEILLQSMGADEGAERLQAVIEEMAHERGAGETAARRELLPQMLVLENSPVLCAYGSVRSGCTLPPKEALAIATATAGRMAPGPYLWHGFGLPPSRLPLMLRPFAPAWQRGPGGAWPVLSKYGYSPVGLEWDLWLSPDDPADLTLAVVDHGTPGDLVQQAVAMALRCQGVAEAMGRRHNQTCGISPMRWLIDFATALNKGQTTDPGKAPEDTRRDTATTPLPLYGPGTGPGSGPHDMPYTDGTACPALQTYLRLTVSGLRGLLDPSAAPLLRASSVGVRVRVTGNTHTHTPVHLKKVTVDAGAAGPAQQTAGGAAGAGGGAARGFTAADIPKGKASSLYPVERADLRGSLLVVEVFDSRAPTRVLARSALPLATLEGRGGAGRVFLVGALQQRKATKEASSGLEDAGLAAGADGGGEGSREGAEGAGVRWVERQEERGKEQDGREGEGEEGEGEMEVQQTDPRRRQAAPEEEDEEGEGAEGQGQELQVEHSGRASAAAPAPAPLPPSLPLHPEEEKARLPTPSRAQVAPGPTPGPVAEGLEHPSAGGPSGPDLGPSLGLGPSLAKGSGVEAPSQQAMDRASGYGDWRRRTGALRPTWGPDHAAPGPVAEANEGPGSTPTPTPPAAAAGASGAGGQPASARQVSISLRADTGTGSPAPNPDTNTNPAAPNRGGSLRPGPSLARGHGIAEIALASRKGGVGVAARASLRRGLTAGSVGSRGGGSVSSRGHGQGQGQGHEAGGRLSVVGSDSEGEGGSSSDSSEGGEGERDDFEGQNQEMQVPPSTASNLEVLLARLPASFRVCEDAAAAEAALKALAGEGKCTVAVELSWETWSTLKAAQELCGLPLHIAQSCTAMLSAPGGLFLDVKSGYSTAPQLRSFASSLMGIGINVKAICSFVPRQIDFEDDSAAQPIPEPTPDTAAAPTPAAVVAATGLGPLPGPMFRPFDTVLFFHGLNGLELACEAGRVPPGTCVLFNGASMLYEDPGAAVEPPDEGEEATRRQEAAAVQQMDGVGRSDAGCLPCLRWHGDSDSRAQGKIFTAAAKARARQVTTAAAEEEAKAGPHGAGPAWAHAGHTQAHEARGAQAVPVPLAAPGRGEAGGEGTAPPDSLPALVDKEAWRRYCTVIDIFKVYGGIYVQEPDCCPAALDALIQLTNTNPGYLPLGFAYGHLGTKAVSAAGHVGRGMAAQQLMEELQSRRKLSRKVEKWIRRGVHVGADDQVYLSWSRRLLTSTELLYLSGQYLVLRLLADYDVGDGDFRTRGERLMHLVDGMGGFCFLFYRFWRHYESFSPFTFDELGFNLNHTKALVRLLRNRGALAAMGADEKAATSAWLVRDRSLRLWQQLMCCRADRHKFVREALVCLVESSTRAEYDAMLRALGGEVYFLRMLTGWTHLRGLYAVRRIRACQAVWEDEGPDTIPITQPSCRYGYVVYARRLPGEGELAPGQGLEEGAFPPGKEPALWRGPGEAEVWYTADPRHSRHKSWQRKAWRLISKCGCCVGTWFLHTWLYTLCGLCYTLCACPVLCYPYCRNRIVPYIIAILLVLLWVLVVAAGISGGTEGSK